ncbi:TRAP transporter large permease [Desulfosoma caldarium]|uniref:Tripartite ATP-independent transporter DctM subunit n=1 Tax=Desulfosoma caldarium TaxID=610254 RepID=A0A3N1UPM7_9BACT|nr:TRAP transporter large permease [Desulfosoma caldarium]ROQ89841.1 tripartite ATP-independent transporter DctM subunit [Desulfosoma caldarium]
MLPMVLFVTLMLLFLANMPIALAIGMASLAALWLHGDLPLMMVIQRLYAGVDSFPLMAVPLFMCAGAIMEAGGISRRVVQLAESIVGWLPGGLAAVAVVSAMFFAGISGSAAADTAAVGAILIPSMIRRGYDKGFAAAVQAAGGSIGVVIPPSIPMIIFGFLTGASIGKLFAAGILPGVLMGLSLMAISTALSWKHRYSTVVAFSWRRLAQCTWDAKWALGAPVVILGGILSGVFTATESAAAATFYALIVGLWVHRELHWKDLPGLFTRSAITASLVLFIIATASIFSWFMAIEDIPARLAEGLLAVTTHPTTLLMLVNALLLLAGTFVETTASLILLVPVILPLVPTMGVDLTQLGVIVVVNLAIGMLTPPLGICLVVSCTLAQCRLEKVITRVGPLLLVLLLDLVLISLWSPLTLWLPSVLHP